MDAVEATEAGNDALRLHEVIGDGCDDGGGCVVETRRSPSKKRTEEHRLEDCDDLQGGEVCSGLRLELDLNSPEEVETVEEKEERLMKQLKVGEYRSDKVCEEENAVIKERGNQPKTPTETRGEERHLSTKPGRKLEEDPNWTAYEILQSESIIDMSPASEDSSDLVYVL